MSSRTHTVLSSPDPAKSIHVAFGVLDEQTGAQLEYRHLIKGADGETWARVLVNEISRLAQGVDHRMPSGTNTVRFIRRNDIAHGRKVTYDAWSQRCDHTKQRNRG